MLQSEIERARQREVIAAFTRNEAEMLERLGIAARPVLNDSERALLAPFVQWCSQHRVRYCPARPATVATYFLEQSWPDADFVLQILHAIERLHDIHGLANPTATAPVRIVLDSVLKIDPPRSWPKEDRVVFALLPPEIRLRIEIRERQRDRGLRHAQNLAAAERKRLTGGAEKSVAIEDTTMGNASETDKAIK